MKNVKPSPTIERLVAWSIQHPLSQPARYLIATLLVGLCAVVRAAVITDLLPWLLFMPVTLLIGLTMERGTGIYSVLLSALLAAVTIARAGATFWLTGAQWVASILFVLVASSQVVVAAEVRSSFVRARRMIEERERINAQLAAQEEQGRLLNQELGHRLKNLLTIVQAVVGQTIRQSTDLASAGKALSFRLAAFGRAADVLTASTWESADLDALARSALVTHDTMAERFRLEGPSIRFRSQVALAMALTLHELATNAMKYGALSNDTGHVEVKWSIERGPDHAEPRFHFTWQEVGGPPVQPPTRRGFGSLMIERSLKGYFRGGTTIDYAPGGLIFRIDAPLAGAQVEDEER